MASRSLGSLTIDLIARIFGFEQGMDKAARIAEKRMKEIEARAKKFGAVVGASLVVGAGIVANQLRNTINQMDELSKAAQRANLPTEEFTKLAYAGELADVSIQDLQSSLGRLAKAQGDAEKATSVQGRIFDALGIATRNAEGNLRSTYEVFLDFADVFQKYQGSPEIVAAGLNIFGRSFQNLIPLLKDGSQGLRAAGDEAERLGLVFDQEAGAAAEKFNDDITRLKSAFAGIFREMAQNLLPALSETTGRLQQLAKEGDLASNAVTLISAAMRVGVGIIDAYGNAVERTSIAIETVANSASGLAEITRNLGPNGLFNEGSVRSGMAAVASAFEDGQRQLDSLIARQNNPFRNVISGATTVSPNSGGSANLSALRQALGGPQRRGGGGGGGKSKEQQEAEQLKRAYDSLIESMDERIALFGKEGEAAKVRYETENGSLKALSDELKATAIARAEQYDQMVLMKELQDAADDAVNKETEAYRDQQKSIREFIGDLEFELALIGMTNIEREKAIALRYANVDAMSEEGRQIGTLIEQIQRASEVESYWMDVQSSMEDAFYDFATGAKNAKDALGDFLDAIYSESIRAASRYFSEQLTNMFKGSGTSGGDSAGWGGFASWIGSIFGGGKASGGWAKANTMYEVNESGLEMATVRGRDYLLTGGSGAQITPAGQWGAGGLQISMVNNFDRNNSQATPEQIAVRTGQTIQRQLARTGR